MLFCPLFLGVRAEKTAPFQKGWGKGEGGGQEEGLTRPTAINKTIVNVGEMEYVSLHTGQAWRVGFPASAR